jgi:hypothetical protein
MSDVSKYWDTLGVLDVLGVGGFVLYMLAFGAVQFQLLDGNSTGYSIANICAAMLVAVSLISEFNLASALIQGSWILIGMTGLILRFSKARKRPGPSVETPQTLELSDAGF